MALGRVALLAGAGAPAHVAVAASASADSPTAAPGAGSGATFASRWGFAARLPGVACCCAYLASRIARIASILLVVTSRPEL